MQDIGQKINIYYRISYKINSVREINVKNLTNYLFDDMINIKNLDPNKIKADEQLYKNILIYRVGKVTVKDLSCASFDSVKPVYLIMNIIDECIEESNRNKYLTLVPTDESKDTLKIYEELWKKMRALIRSITKNSNNYDKKYMKTKLYSDDNLSLKKTLELYSTIEYIVARSVFHEGSKYYPQVLYRCITVHQRTVRL